MYTQFNNNLLTSSAVVNNCNNTRREMKLISFMLTSSNSLNIAEFSAQYMFLLYLKDSVSRPSFVIAEFTAI
jgi:hypothetical protein